MPGPDPTPEHLGEDTRKYVENRLRRAQIRWWKVQSTIREPGLSERFKVQILKDTVEATLYYGSETRIYTQKDEDALQIFLNKCLRASVMVNMSDMKGGKHVGGTTMSDLRVEYGQATAAATIGWRKLLYVGQFCVIQSSRTTPHWAMYTTRSSRNFEANQRRNQLVRQKAAPTSPGVNSAKTW